MSKQRLPCFSSLKTKTPDLFSSVEEITGWEFDSTGCVGKYTVTDKGQDIKGEALSPEAGLLKYKGRHTDTEDGFEYRATGELPDGKKTDYHGIWTKKSVK